MKSIKEFISIVSLSILILSCSRNNKIHFTSEQRVKDIKFLSSYLKNNLPSIGFWGKKYNVSFDSLSNHFISLAATCRNDTDFFLLTLAYITSLKGNGHTEIRTDLVDNCVHNGKIIPGYSAKNRGKMYYWQAYQKWSPVVLPPFLIDKVNQHYFLKTNWQIDNNVIPAGSEILRVEGQDCRSYLDSLKRCTWLRFFPEGPVFDHFKRKLLIFNIPDPDFQGWNVNFKLPNKKNYTAFVPAQPGIPFENIRPAKVNYNNCICRNLNDTVGYIYVRNFKAHNKMTDWNKITSFFHDNKEKMKKLIIDIRGGGGGNTHYYQDLLIKPFLYDTITYYEKVGMKKSFVQSLSNRLCSYLQDDISTLETGVVNVKIIAPPEGFNKEDWRFFELTRRIIPSGSYGFTGRIIILTDEYSVSAKDNFVFTMQKNKLATIVGQPSGGMGSRYIGAMPFILPETGIILRFDFGLSMNAHGMPDFIFGNEPDISLKLFYKPEYEYPNDFSIGSLLQDKWIHYVITEL